MLSGQRPSLGFIGAGNMASALIGGLVKKGYPGHLITVSDPHPEKRQTLAKRFQVSCTPDNEEVIESAEIIVLAIKPTTIIEFLKKHASQNAHPLWITVAAGVSMHCYESYLGPKAAVVRAMPNTPALISESACGLYANQNVNADQKKFSENLMRTVGSVVWVDKDSDMDIVTGLSGSGPAYFFYMMEHLVKTAVAEGLPEADAIALIAQTAIGAGKMALSKESLSQLREKVTSEGGTTQAGLKSFNESNVDAALAKGLQAAIARSKEISAQSTPAGESS